MEKCVMEAGELFARILAVKSEDYIEPEKGKGAFELTGHIMSDFEKKVYTVFRQLTAEIDQLRQKMESNEIPKNEIGKIKAELNVLNDKINSTKNFFYFLISDRIKMWGTDIGVSKGWKIIIPDIEAEREEIALAVKIPRELSQLLEALKNAIRSEVKIEKEDTSTVSNMIRNMVHQNGSKTFH